jgi:N4-gp56 family major capsid protein
MFDKFAQAKFIPANSGVTKMFAFRYRSLKAATVPLVEGVLPNESKIVREKVEYTVAQYGSYITYTDRFDLFDVDSVKGQFLDILGDQAALTSDEIIRNVISNGSRVIYGNSKADRDAAEGIKKTDLQLAVLNLKNARAEKYKAVNSGSTNIGSTPIRSAYIGITHPNLVEDLRELDGWRNVEEYAYSKDIMEDEVGSWGDIRFVENTNALVVNRANGDPIYMTLILAKDAYASTSVRGKGGTQTIFKGLDSGGVENALNQKGSIGWKMYAGAKILNELFMVRIESTASINVGDLIRWSDNADSVNDESGIDG